MQSLTPVNYEDGFKRLVLIARKQRKDRAGDGPVRQEERFTKNVCSICGYTWKCKPDCKPPAHCPSCRSSLWNEDGLFRHTCSVCGHKWVSRKEDPIRCPGCKSKNWAEKTRKYECADCGHTLEVTVDKNVSGYCPNCGSTNWGYDYIRCLCKRCGYVGYYKPDRPGRCPMCKSTVYTGRASSSEAEEYVGRVEVNGEIIDILNRSADLGEMQALSCLLDCGVSYEDAGIMLSYTGGRNEVEIARDMDVAYGTVRTVVNDLNAQGLQRIRT